MTRRTCRPLVLLSAMIVMTACGKKGPPLAPLRLAPDAAAEFTARRLGADVHLRFLVPSRNAGAPGPVEIDRVEVYAVSVPAGAPAPPNRELLSAKHLVGTVPVRAVQPGEAPPDPAVADTRPAPGEPATFVEPLTTEMMNPPSVAAPAPPASTAAPSSPPAAAAPVHATRIYAVRGITRSGRPGAPSTRLSVPLVQAPEAPRLVTAANTETSFTISWTPPVAEATAGPLLFHVYRAEAPSTPLTPAPTQAATFDVPGVEFGGERCFSVRTHQQVAGISIESEPSKPECVTPRDTFPPAAPTGLTGVATPGLIALIWNANAEKDLGGYIVLRGEAPGETLQPLTPAPIRETAFRDTTVKPGVRYIYAIVAVDSATPPNRSAESRREEVIAAQ